MEREIESPQRKGSLSDSVLLKLLVPSVAAGAIIGKGGEAIAQVQKDHGAKVKMSKASDFYPGTTERVCLIQGNLESVQSVCDYIVSKILEKPDPNPRIAGDGKLNVERHKQVKLLVPNSTAGMIIGKKGAQIKEIMDDSGAYVQVSQKPKEHALSERCVTIAGDVEQNREALRLILAKVSDDPASGSCPGISYSTVSGPVASAFPTGSPYAGSAAAAAAAAAAGGGGGGAGQQQQQQQQQQQGTVSLNSSQSSFTSMSIEALRASLRNSGYNDVAADDIVSAMLTLANYGFFNMQSLLPSGGGLSPQPMPLVASPHSSLSLPPGSLSGLGPLDASKLPAAAAAAAAAGMPPDFGAAAAGPFGDTGPFMMGTSGQQAAAAAAMFDASGSFGSSLAQHLESEKLPQSKRELEIPEPLVGVIIGQAGKDIAELQTSTRTSIQVSKRGEQQANARFRMVTITGAQPNVAHAERIIQQKVQQEEMRRQQAAAGVAPHMKQM